MVIVHSPFTKNYPECFFVEENEYSKWSQILETKIRPHIMLCGHKHELRIDKDATHSYPIVIGSDIKVAEKYFAGAGLIFSSGNITIIFSDNEKIISEEILEL